MADEETLDLYVVQWPERGIIKVGISKNERWRDFGGGVQLVATFRARPDLARAIEKEAHERLSARCVRPFRYGHMAKALLGKNGEGHSECYLDDGTVFTEVIGIAADVVSHEPDLHLTAGRAEDGTPLFVAGVVNRYIEGYMDGRSAVEREQEGAPDRYDEGYRDGSVGAEAFQRWWPKGGSQPGRCGHCETCVDYAERGSPMNEEPYCWATDTSDPEEGDDDPSCKVCGELHCILGRVRENGLAEGNRAGTQWVIHQWLGHWSFYSYRCLSTVVDHGDASFEWALQR